MDFLRYSSTTLPLPALGFTLELGRMGIPESFLAANASAAAKAFAAMQALEAGTIANPDEKRMVGHYWLRAPQLSPDEKTRGDIEGTLFRVVSFAKKIHAEGRFRNLLVIGIGGSALGPQFVAQALDLGQNKNKNCFVEFFKNLFGGSNQCSCKKTSTDQEACGCGNSCGCKASSDSRPLNPNGVAQDSPGLRCSLPGANVDDSLSSGNQVEDPESKMVSLSNPRRACLALSNGSDRYRPTNAGNQLTPYFLDNTDPDGIDRTLAALDLKKTLVVVISKSGSTPETRNGMLEAQNAFRRAKVNFARNAVAITQDGSALDQLARREGWLERFPMWDYVGGRTSITSAVGLLPMALQGIDIGQFLAGAAEMDKATRVAEMKQNPAMMLALAWFFATGGVGAKAMVVLPYKDRLSLLTKYLQQLIMESLGKAQDLDGKRVHQGLTVYGNKGSTDQHAYVQQLRDGLNNFFVTFIEVQKERDTSCSGGKCSAQTSAAFEVDSGITSGDYLQGFCLGSAVALEENFRQSMTLTLHEVSPFTIGALIALYERAVGFYATLINVNAYHQPGVEAGKKAATAILSLKTAIVAVLKKSAEPLTAEALARALEEPNKADLVYRILERLSANAYYPVKKCSPSDANPFNATYRYEG